MTKTQLVKEIQRLKDALDDARYNDSVGKTILTQELETTRRSNAEYARAFIDRNKELELHLADVRLLLALLREEQQR